MSEENVEVSREHIKKILYKLMEIEMLSTDYRQKKDIQYLIDFIQRLAPSSESENISLEDLVYNKMVETKGIDDELNAKLYILYQDLKNDKISRDKAFEIYNIYMRMEGMN